MAQSPDSNAITEGIRVRASARYIPEQSDPDRGDFFFAYTISIANEGSEPARLVARHWIIKDSDNHREDVRGPGVVGETPRLESGESFEYQSNCPLHTPWGTMEGVYQMRRDDETTFNAEIGRFFLVADQLKKGGEVKTKG